MREDKDCGGRDMERDIFFLAGHELQVDDEPCTWHMDLQGGPWQHSGQRGSVMFELPDGLMLDWVLRRVVRVLPRAGQAAPVHSRNTNSPVRYCPRECNSYCLLRAHSGEPASGIL